MPSEKIEKISSKCKAKFSETTSLPRVSNIKRIVENFWKTWKFDGVTLSIRNSDLFITADNEQVLAKTCAIIGSLIRQEVTGDSQMRSCPYSEQINSFSYQKQKHSNKIKMIWKQSYIDRWKLNAEFKDISKYYRTSIRRRHPEVSFLQQKTLRKTSWKRRAVYRASRTRRLKRRHKRKQIQKNKWKQTLLKNAPNYNRHEYKRQTSEISKLKFITVDAPKIIPCQSEKKTNSGLKDRTGCVLENTYNFSLDPWIDKLLNQRRNFIIRYSNQHIFIYTPSVGTKRLSKRNLVHRFSTLNGDGIE